MCLVLVFAFAISNEDRTTDETKIRKSAYDTHCLSQLKKEWERQNIK